MPHHTTRSGYGPHCSTELGAATIRGIISHRPTSNRLAYPRFEALELRRLLAFPVEADASFGTAGAIDSSVLNFTGAADQTASLSFLAPRAGGKTLVGGHLSVFDGDLENDTLIFAGAQIARLNADGSLDTTFNRDGRSPIVPFNRVHDGLVQGDGKVVLVGQSRGGRAAAARFNADGSIDKHFGLNGVAELPLPPGARAADASAVALAPGGKLLLAADVSRSNAPTNYSDGTWIQLSRLTSAGKPDTSFDGDGVAVVNPAHSDTRDTFSNVTDIAALGNGKILFVGNVNFGGILARYNANGSPDTTFNPGGKFAGMIYRDDNPLMAQFDHVNKVLPLADGKVLVAGDGLVTWPGDGVVARFNADGSRDNSFGTGGSRHGIGYEAFDVALDSDGGVLVLDTNYYLDWAPAVHRLTPSGAYDADFDVAQFGDFDSGKPIHLALTADGRVIAESEQMLARLTPRPRVALGANGLLKVTGEENFNNVISFHRSGNTVTLTRNGVVTTYPRDSVKGYDIVTFAGHDTIEATSDTLFKEGLDFGNAIHSAGGRDVITMKNIDGFVVSSSRLRFRAEGGRINLEAIGTGPVEATFTGSAPDTIYTGYGNDTIHCGTGNDTVYSGAGNDLVDLSDGTNTAQGGDGNDTLLGGNGRDSLSGGDGNDSINGGAGNDTLAGEGGINTLIGGAGADQLFGNPGDSHDKDPLDQLVGF